MSLFLPYCGVMVWFTITIFLCMSTFYFCEKKQCNGRYKFMVEQLTSCMMTWSIFGRWCNTYPSISRFALVTQTFCLGLNFELVTAEKPGPIISPSMKSLIFRFSSNRTVYRMWFEVLDVDELPPSGVFISAIMPGYKRPSSPGATTLVPSIDRLANLLPVDMVIIASKDSSSPRTLCEDDESCSFLWYSLSTLWSLICLPVPPS